MIDFELYFEYINDADMERAHAAELKLQERRFRTIISAVIRAGGISRFLSWL